VPLFWKCFLFRVQIGIFRYFAVEKINKSLISRILFIFFNSLYSLAAIRAISELNGTVLNIFKRFINSSDFFLSVAPEKSSNTVIVDIHHIILGNFI
jgi:hypothetical protein